MIPPTIAEERIAKMLALWHGQTPVWRDRDGTLQTVASYHGSRSGRSWELDQYVDRHWREYLAAARGVMELR